MKFDAISICISTKNRKKILQHTLDVIFHKQNLPHSQFEVIVTNDGDEHLDDLKDKFPYSNFLIVPNKHKAGLAGGRNNGIEHAKHPLVIFFDDDILVTPSFFEQIITSHNLYNPIILGGNRFYPDDLIKKAQTYPFGRYKLLYEYQWLDKNTIKLFEKSLFEVDSVAGFSMSLTKETYAKVGPFNENFQYAGCEDAEFCYRAKKMGVRILFDEQLVCYHNELDNFELKSWLKRQSTGILSALVICQLHPEGKEHPTWFTNTPIQKNDPLWVKKLKLKKWLLSRWIVDKFLFAIVRLFEKWHMPDSILFRLYNALWLGHTYRSFSKEYKKLFR
ncbi:MAG: glycosyltransferase [Bacteroidales bacterium]|nr:glycosyltransferase [Bacteroidales bacterium]